MKKIILAALVAFSAVTANAQVWLGGSLGFKSEKANSDAKSQTTFTISPEIGYTLSDKWDIAIAFNEQNISCDGTSVNAFSVAPYARFTFAKAGIASFFVDGGFQFGSTNAATLTEDGVTYLAKGDNVTTFGIGLRPGVKVSLSEKVGLVAKLGYLGYQQTKDGPRGFGLNIDNTNVSLGMYWNF